MISGNYLREKYDGATDVQVNRRGRLQVKDMQIRVPTASDLVYLDESPDYCVRNENVGILGTSGRVCNRTSHGLDGCKLLCCGRGYNTIKTTVKERCQCTFKWCCEVKCKTCIKPVDVHTCKWHVIPRPRGISPLYSSFVSVISISIKSL